MLTPLQERIRRTIGAVADGVELALAGGGGLVVSGVVDRGTTDLDFFARHPSPHTEVVELVEAALEAAGLQVTRYTEMPHFTRLRVNSSADFTWVDLGVDYRLSPVERTDGGDVLAVEELAADKVATLEVRAEARDFVDFAALTERFTVAELCELAASKDGGFQGHMLADRLAAFEQIDVEEFAAYPVDYHHLRSTIAAAAAEVARLHPGPSGLDVQLY